MTRLVIHADDVGMCHGANRAFVQLSRRDAITSGSVMVPCPWFSGLVHEALADPSLDLGVHLTLTSEHRGYRWGPVGTHSPAAGLVDDHGYLWPDVASVRRHAHPDAVEAELRAQLDRALAVGLDVTHLDAHMGGAMAPEWIDRYVGLGIEYRLPVLLTKDFTAYGPRDPHLADVEAHQVAAAVELAAGAGLPLFDQVVETDFRRPPGAPVGYRPMFAGITGELVFAALHPAAPGELEGIEPHAPHIRTDEYHLFASWPWVEWLDQQPFTRVGMRALRDEVRA